MTESLRERSSSAKAGSSGWMDESFSVQFHWQWMDETFSVQRLLKTKPHTLSNSSSSARISSTSSSPPFPIANTAIVAASSIFSSSIFLSPKNSEQAVNRHDGSFFVLTSFSHFLMVRSFDVRSFSHFLFLRHRIICWPGPLPKG